MKLPPPLTAGIHDFFGCAAAAATIDFPGVKAGIALAPNPADNKSWLLLPPVKKVELEPNPPTNALDVAAISFSLSFARVSVCLNYEDGASGTEFSI